MREIVSAGTGSNERGRRAIRPHALARMSIGRTLPLPSTRPMSLRPSLFLASVALVVLAACDSTAGPGDDGPTVFDEAEARLGEWSFFEVEGSQCRDGSPAGFGVRLQEGAEDLVIVLAGGGACFNGITCAVNPTAYDAAELERAFGGIGDQGIFSLRADNPVGAWNAVYVPYCTGDVHGGSAPNASVPGVSGAQQFVGHQNIERFLGLMAPYFGDPDRVLLAGISAGGFGTLVNFASVADAFPDSDPFLLNDSGPIAFDDAVFSPEIGGTFAQLYNFPASFPSDAGALFEPDGLAGVYDYYAERYPDATFGLASYLEDDVIRFFFGFGQPDGTITGAEYAAGLRDLRARLPSSWGTYLATGEGHTFLGDEGRYTATSAGVRLDDWLADLLDGRPTNVDPALATVAAR